MTVKQVFYSANICKVLIREVQWIGSIYGAIKKKFHMMPPDTPREAHAPTITVIGLVLDPDNWSNG